MASQVSTDECHVYSCLLARPDSSFTTPQHDAGAASLPQSEFRGFLDGKRMRHEGPHLSEHSQLTTART
jgi:hypothetical protein